MPSRAPQLKATLRAAHNTQRWVRVLAKRYHCPAAVIRRQIRTARGLEAEVAPIVAEYILAEARAALAGSAMLPADDGTLSQAIRRCYDALATRQAPAVVYQAAFGGERAKTLKDFEVEAPPPPREQQDAATREKLDAQTNDILRLLKQDQVSG